MQFDYIVGNPPYQDKKSSDAGGLYLDITKKIMNLLSKDGIIDFLTPITLSQEKKTGFTLRGKKGLKLIDYTINEKFNVGVRIMRWQIDKNYYGKVTVINKDGTVDERENTESLVDYKDKIPFELFERIKENKNKMFVLDQTTGNKNKKLEKDNIYKLPLNVNKKKNKVHYTKKIPKLYKKRKIAISVSAAYNIENIYIDSEDYGQLYCCIDIDGYTKKQESNILNFLFHPLIVDITKKYKLLYGVGTNAILYSFPNIDIDKEYAEKDIIDLFSLSEEEIKYLKS